MDTVGKDYFVENTHNGWRVYAKGRVAFCNTQAGAEMKLEQFKIVDAKAAKRMADARK